MGMKKLALLVAGMVSLFIGGIVIGTAATLMVLLPKYESAQARLAQLAEARAKEESRAQAELATLKAGDLARMREFAEARARAEAEQRRMADARSAADEVKAARDKARGC